MTLVTKRSDWNNRVDNNKVKHLTEKVSQIRSIGPRAIPNGIIPSLEMNEYIIELEILNYPKFIEKKKAWPLFGSFIDYALRRIISRITKIPVVDNRCEDVIALKGKVGPLKFREDIISNITAAYDRYKNPILSTKSTLYDTWLVSLTHSIWFDSLSEERYDLLASMVLSLEEQVKWTDRLKAMIRGLGQVIGFEPTRNKVICNPNLSISGLIKADADLIIGNVIIDFECSRNDPVNTKNFIQILGYTTLARYLKVSEVSQVIILNFLSGKIYIQDISEWDSSSFY